jgi:hypothetical protein
MTSLPPFPNPPIPTATPPSSTASSGYKGSHPHRRAPFSSSFTTSPLRPPPYPPPLICRGPPLQPLSDRLNHTPSNAPLSTTTPCRELPTTTPDAAPHHRSRPTKLCCPPLRTSASSAHVVPPPASSQPSWASRERWTASWLNSQAPTTADRPLTAALPCSTCATVDSLAGVLPTSPTPLIRFLRPRHRASPPFPPVLDFWLTRIGCRAAAGSHGLCSPVSPSGPKGQVGRELLAGPA